ncbi:uncharacterized protein F5147DRAFT_781666 [Suillus discolor]|uniref:Uncharacterized protein n=1 Tax=Suillus discolor TaxID=1912936 RepID=A0A9P7ER90_9AGAM|nr:uncharacterized protein F5147DRAFT_781666 [Suillus discolor]KAG2086323.1 hypothetical protein F5147DRAFT_781666 [Suillus discolor]
MYSPVKTAILHNERHESLHRLLLLLAPPAISRKGALALSSSSAGVDGLRWWIDCQWNPTLQFELRLLLFLLEEHVYSGDLWCLVMAYQIEFMQGESLHNSQLPCRVLFDREREFMEDKKDRAQLELSLYSQAIDLLQLKAGSRPASSRPVIQLSARDWHPLDRLSRVGSLAHLKCNEWLSKVSTSGDSDDDEADMGFDRGVGPAMVYTAEESTSIASKLMMLYKTLVVCNAGHRPYQLVNTWVEECTEDFYMDDLATERASLQIMILRANDLSNAEDETSFLQAELGLMQSRFHRA